MRRCTSLINRLIMAALVSALAALLMVAVGPGFAENDNAPNENASQTAQGNAAEKDEAGGETAVAADTLASENANTEDGTKDTPSADAESEAAATTFDPDASSTPDQHGHIGAGTGNPEGSQADPGHKEDTNGTDGKTNGPGTGDEPADECLNEQSSAHDPPAEDNDFSGAGANKHGPYDSTCDGRISQNGQGDDAPGKGTPCAGCVGNADDKNPPGQVKEFYGTKKNDMGYECDGNQGVGAHYGNGNPAHTGDCGGDTTHEFELVCRMDVNGNFEIVQIVKGTRLETDKDADAEECDDDTPPDETPDCLGHVPPHDNHQAGMPACDNTTPEDQPDCLGHVPPHDNHQAGMPACDNTTPEDQPDCLGHVPPHDNHQMGSPACNNVQPTLISICYEVSEGNWAVEEDIDATTIGNYSNARVVPKGTPASSCEEVVLASVISICYQDANGNWAVAEDIKVTDIVNYSNAKVVAKGTPASSCEEGGGGGGGSSHVYVCHATGSTPAWEVIRISVSALPAHLGHGDKVVLAGTDADECEDMPEVQVCPAGTDMAGLPFPADLNCNLAPEEELPNRLCPADSDRPMRVIPTGQDESWCNDEVQGEVITRPASPKNPEPGNPSNPGNNVAPNRLQNRPETAPSRQPRGGILPFTGASVLAFLVLALQLIAAGTLILRGKRA